MPPKPKFTREQIIGYALNIVERDGIKALTARELGKEMGSSARPIFTVFKNMDELCSEVFLAAREKYDSFVLSDHKPGPFFRNVGMRMVAFAIKHPRLYQLLFMSEIDVKSEEFSQLYGRLGKTVDICVNSIMTEHGINEQQARKVFDNLFVYTFGIAVFCATGVCNFPAEKIERMLAFEFKSIMYQVINPNLDFSAEKKTVDQHTF